METSQTPPATRGHYSPAVLSELSRMAWEARELARLTRPEGTQVGAVVLDQLGMAYPGCNIEHRFRCHDIHAEVSALARMASSNAGARAGAILIAAKRDLFTPCGSCMDWVFELGTPSTRIIHESSPGVVTHDAFAGDLMPYYPR